MLEGLDKVDWPKPEHAYGSAYDVPELLRSLLESDKDERDEALYELFANIWHQGTVYEATSYSVPFICELLGGEETPDKEGIAHLLAVISAGVGYYEIHASDEADASRWKRRLKSESKNLCEEITIEGTIVKRVRDACGPHLGLLLPYLMDPNLEIRDSVARAFSFYPDQRDQFLPELRNALQVEGDEECQEAIRESIAALESEA